MIDPSVYEPYVVAIIYWSFTGGIFLLRIRTETFLLVLILELFG